MRIFRREKEPLAVVFENIEPFFIEVLRELPGDADPRDHAGARARLFSEPMGKSEDGDAFLDDWANYVQPEIRALFLSARAIVADDLAALADADPSSSPALQIITGDGQLFDPADFAASGHSVTIPVDHLEAWLRVLNQARLVLAARRGFDEKSMGRERPFPPFVGPHERDMFKINFYDDIQQLLMQAMGYG